MKSWTYGAVGLAAGLLIGSLLLGDLGETPCYEVDSQAQDHREALFRDPAAADAYVALLNIARDNPGCFSPETVDMLRAGLESTRTDTGEREVDVVTPRPEESS